MADIYCQGCGRELLDRNAFNPDKGGIPLCLRCRFSNAVWNPNAHPTHDKIREIPISEYAEMARKTVSSEIRAPVKRQRVLKRETPTHETREVHPEIRYEKPIIKPVKVQGVEVEGDENLAKEALDEIEEIEGLKKKVKK